MTLYIFLILILLIFIGIPVGLGFGIAAIIKYEKKRSGNKFVQPAPDVYGPFYRPPQPPPKPKTKLSASAVMLLIGTIFIMLSAITFVAANWVNMEPSGRVFTLAGVAVVAFALCAVLKAAVHLERTSAAFYMLGTLIGLVAFCTAGVYELFGEWFSFMGMGCGLYLAVSSSLVAVSAFAGYSLYKHASFNYTGFVFVYLAIFFICIQIPETFKGLAVAIAIAQLLITAVLHVIKPQKGTLVEKPAVIVGDIFAVCFQMVSMFYVLVSTIKPTWYTFTILLILIGQLFLYGFLKNQRWMFIFADIAGIYAALVISCFVDIDHDDTIAVLVFAAITLIIYIVNCVIPKNPTAAKVISFIGLIIGAFSSLAAAGTEESFGLNLVVPLAAIAATMGYCLHKSRDIQFIAGITLPVLPFSIAYTINNELFRSGDYQSEMLVIIYGALALVYLIIAAFFAHLHRFAFDFYKKHPVRAHTAEYSAMIAAAVTLLVISDYSELFFVTLALCLLHFIASGLMRSNAAAIGSVIAFVLTIDSVLREYCVGESASNYILFGLFIVLIAASRLIYPEAIIKKEAGNIKTDVLLLGSWVALFCMNFIGEEGRFLVFMSTAAFIAAFAKKNTDKDVSAIILSISAFAAAVGFMLRPFLVTDSSLITSKINLGIMVLLGIAYKFIWREQKDVSKVISTIVFILSFAGLIIDGLVHPEMGNRIFVLAVTAAILILSFYAKSKTWFIASSVALVFLTVVLTAKYFKSAGWWVYLLAVGVIFIVISAINEACKKKGESMKETVTKTFSDWTW